MTTGRQHTLRDVVPFPRARLSQHVPSDGAALDAHAHLRNSSRSLWFDRWLLGLLVRSLRGVPVRCVLWDGTALVAEPCAPVAEVRIKDRSTLMGLLIEPDLHFARGYIDGRLDVDGDLVGMLSAVAWKTEQARAGRPVALPGHTRAVGIAAASRNARYHYDLGNDFYRRWLDEEMVYTCAYYAAPAMTLEEAQRAKLEHVARKLALRPGERVFESGCGWGALALHMAREHGVHVRAWNVAREQVAWARRRAREEHLDDRVEFVEGDYRTIDGECDAFVSVGMLEHVGPRQYPALAEVMDRCLSRDHGRGLLHFIGRNAPAPPTSWITRDIFPGGYIPSLREVLALALEPHGFSVIDVENLRLHYARTLAEWLARYDRAVPELRGEFDERFVRMWRLYLAESQAGFRGGNLQLFQITFTRGNDTRMPLTRAHLYATGPGRPS